MNNMNDKIQINFISPSKEIIGQLNEEFPNAMIFKQKSFSGFEMVTVIITTSAIYLDKILNFFIQNRKNSKGTSIKISTNEIILNGYSDKEIEKIIKTGSLKYLKDLIKRDDKEGIA